MTDELRRVLIIYTGGTVGMKHTEHGYAPVAGWMESQLQSLYAFQDPDGPPRTMPPARPGLRISYDIIEYEPLLDSANMEVRHWVKIARDIESHYDTYDGFVVLHGTDTMAYTASALSFMLVNLRKTVVLTGSQIPLSQVRNDAVNNLLGAITMAGLYEIPEVCLFFDKCLYRGNRVRKVDASGLGAFDSGNLPPLATVGIEIEVAWHLVRSAPSRPLRLRPIEDQNVICLRLFPGMSADLLNTLLQPPVRGVVLETYGAGNIPSTRAEIVRVIHDAVARGVIIVNCTQCFQGTVTSDYAAGSILKQIGVCSGFDMTPEAALTKLAYLLSQSDVAVSEIEGHMTRDLRGELTDRRQNDRVSFQEQGFIDAVAKVLAQGESPHVSAEVADALFPVLMCSAASQGDMEAIERMVHSRVSVDSGDYDGRTALHLAAAEGQLEVVDYLLSEGADHSIYDRWGCVPLRDALQGGHDAVAQRLAEAGARIEPTQLIEILCVATSGQRIGDVQRLLRHGADPSLAGSDGRTPIHLAAAQGSLELIELFLRAGALPSVTDRAGRTPIDDAREAGHASAVARLEEAQ